MGKAATQSTWKRRRKCKSTVAFLTRVVIYLALATYANLRCVWNWLVEPQGPHCRLPSRDAPYNKTRLKVLVYGIAKTGTTSTVRLLNQIYNRVYHAEDLAFHIWSPLADEFWTRKKSNGSIWYFDRLATPSFPAYKGHSFYERYHWSSDLNMVWPVLREETGLSESLERCHVDGASFDGFEELFWNFYERSPEAKVVMLNWRTWDEIVRSRTNWNWNKFWILLGQNMIQCGFHFLPWGALLIPPWDYMTNTSTHVLKNGEEIVSRNNDVGYAMFRVNIMERRIVQHWFGGFSTTVDTEEKYMDFWEEAKQRVPKERLVELDLKKHSPADVCRLLGVTDRPICKDTGRIDNVFPLLRPEKDNPWLFPKTGVIYLSIHFVNYWLFWGVVYAVCGKVLSFVLLIGSALTSIGKPSKAKKKGKSA